MTQVRNKIHRGNTSLQQNGLHLKAQLASPPLLSHAAEGTNGQPGVHKRHVLRQRFAQFKNIPKMTALQYRLTNHKEVLRHTVLSESRFRTAQLVFYRFLL